MTFVLRLASLLWWFAIATWFAVITAAGIAAAFVFGNLRRTGLVLPDHPVSPELHWRYAAGRVMIDVFTTVDIGQAIAAGLGSIALVAIAIAAPAMRRRTSFRIQVAAFVLAMGSFATYAATLAPEMNATLRAQWAAAQAGDEAEAERLRASFEGGHRRSNTLFRLTLLAVLVSGGAAAIGAAPRAGDDRTANDGRGSRLEEPRLAATGPRR